MNTMAVVVFVLLFALVTVIGFAAARWRAGDLTQLHEWGLGGKRFGTIVSWFLLGGDLYTAYTFIAVPALIFGAGAFGFFAVPYTIMIYPLAFLVLPKLWAVAHQHGHVTAADFVRRRFDSSALALAIAVTGIVATMPYIALQLVGIQVVISALGFPTGGWVGELPLVISFVILAAFTYSSGLRAPAMIAVVKDVLIYVTVIAVIIAVPLKLGGYGAVFSAVPPAKLLLAGATAQSTAQISAYATLALGSAFALFLYPHSLTAVLSASSPGALRRNAALLPAYSLLLGLLALMGYMALALGVDKMPEYAAQFAQYKANFAVPALILDLFPSWFVGVAFAAIAIGALVPAAIMSIAAANLFTRNVYREFINQRCTTAQETRMAKLMSLLVKFGALLFVVGVPSQYAIQLQLLGGIWIIQTLPAVVLGLYLRWLEPKSLLLGWAVGIGWGTWAAWSLHFAGSVYPLHVGGITVPGYIALYAVVLNGVVAALGSVIERTLSRPMVRAA